MNKINFFKEMMLELGYTEVEVKIDQNLYPKPDWASHQIVRSSGLIEDICKEHGVGHPNTKWLKIHDPNGSRGFGIHGCCRCCIKHETKI